MIKQLSLCVALTGVLGVNAMAAQSPQSLATDSGIKVITYNPNDVTTIVGKKYFTTTIEFGKNEVVNGKNITSGDSASWMASPYQDKPNFLALKPTRVGSDTNMTIVTNKHTYYFHLVSESSGEPTYAVKFLYPMQELSSIQAKAKFSADQNNALVSNFNAPSDYNWDYTFNGDETIMPVRVFDDHKFTYLQFAKNIPQPAIFAVDNPNGDEAVVNTRRKGDWVVIQRVAPQFTLRLGKNHVASIFNKPYIQSVLNHKPITSSSAVFAGKSSAYHPTAANYKQPHTTNADQAAAEKIVIESHQDEAKTAPKS
ncbi:MAG: P-type conjugative transfer protein VirB9 [Gammaproteobacteria bacterium]|nr:MAG: P-type conjugative transfer protein VirB9 [Gammaproteobacteria bacterium]